MELREAIEQRHSYRAFAADPVPRAVLERMFFAASRAPSSLNSQPWRFHVVTGESHRDEVLAVMGQTTRFLDEYVDLVGAERLEEAKRFFSDLGHAPVIMALSVPVPEDELTRINHYLAAGAAVQNLLLAVTEEGLGACNITFSYWVRDQLAEVFGVGAGREVLSLIALGKPAEEPEAPPHSVDIADFLD